MRLALVISSLGPGGAEKVLSGLAGDWHRRGHAVTILTLERPGAQPFHPLDPGVAVLRLGLAGESASLLAAVGANLHRLRSLRSALRAVQPDLVVAFIDQTNVLSILACAGTGIPVVVSERVHPGLHPLPRLWRSLRALTYPLAAAVVAQTGQCGAALPWPARRRLRVIANAIETPPVAPRLDNRVVVAAGRLVRQKGFDRLLEAFARVATRFPDWRLDIWGEGPERRALETQRDRLGLTGRVRLPGTSSAPGLWLAEANLFVLSSRYEGFPNVLAEAMAAGLPCAAFDCAGAGELIECGYNGLLAPEGDIDGLAEAITRLMGDGDLRRALGDNARAVAQRFCPDTVLAQWEEVLAQAAG